MLTQKEIEKEIIKHNKDDIKKEYQAKFLGMDSNTWLCIGILTTIILVIFGIQTYLHQPKFNINQITCWNESKIVGRELVNIKTEMCNYTEFWQGCMECSKHCINKDKYYANCKTNVSKCEIYTSTFIVEYSKEIYIIPHEDWRDIIEIEQKCKIEEVGLWIFIYNNGSIEGYVPFRKVKDTKTQAKNIVDNYDLTEDFINKNCECVEKDCPTYYHYSDVYSKFYNEDCYINNAFYDIIMISHKPKVCVKWKCGKYEVTKND